MSQKARVVWSEGMFLRTQHFQQQDRWIEGLVRGAVGSLRGNAWGFNALELDSGLLAQGKIALRRCAGILPDGTPFAIPDEAPHPDPLLIPPGSAQTTVYLTLPIELAGATEIDPMGKPATGARYAAREVELRDSIAHAEGMAPVHIAEMRFGLRAGAPERDSQTDLAIARVAAVQAGGGLVLDPEFAPPCLQFGSSPWLVSFVDEVQGKLTSVAEERAAFVAGKRPQGAGDLADFLILQLGNRYLAGARHLAALGSAHPEDIYRWLLEFLAEASTFATSGVLVAPEMEPYRHAECWQAFRPLMTEVRRVLLDLARPDRKAIQIPLKRYPSGVRAAEVQDRGLFGRAVFFIAVQAPVSADRLRQLLPGQIKIGPAEDIQSIVRAAVPGIPISHVPTIPREIPVRRGMVYFELDRQNDYWRRLSKSAGLAIHVTGDLSEGMDMECWAVRN